MGMSIYYSAERKNPLSNEENKKINAIVEEYSISYPYKDIEEDFDVYKYDDSEPNVIFNGSTRLPWTPDDLNIALTHWVACLSDVTRVISTAQWTVNVDDVYMIWDEVNGWQFPPIDISEKKRALREEFTLKAAALPGSYTGPADKLICEAVIKTAEYQNAETVFCFIGRSSEIDTRPIIENALGSGKRLCVPKCVATGVMEARRITGFDELAPAKFGLLEPVDSCALVLPPEIDFAVVPCAACSPKGLRLGFGGGYYDRYLSGACFFTCVICRSELLCEEIPTESHDITPDMLITEDRLIILSP